MDAELQHAAVGERAAQLGTDQERRHDSLRRLPERLEAVAPVRGRHVQDDGIARRGRVQPAAEDVHAHELRRFRQPLDAIDRERNRVGWEGRVHLPGM